MTDNNEISLENRLEWDFEDIDKNSWGKGEWLNEPDKVQCIKEGYHCLILRAHTGALCGYVGVDVAHPCYGLTGDGISSLVDDIIQADFREELVRAKGDPNKMNFIERPEPNSDAGRAMLGISVHGGITYTGANTNSSKAVWLDFRGNFKKARQQARLYPRGDSARWLKKWAKAEHDYSEFRRIIEQTCICLAGLPDQDGGEADSLWWLGFDCAHAGDLAPALEAMTKHFHFKSELEEKGWKDVYRNLEYVESECLQLAIQLRAIEEHANDKSKE